MGESACFYLVLALTGYIIWGPIGGILLPCSVAILMIIDPIERLEDYGE